MKKKIYILTNTLTSGGAEKQSILLTKALSENYNTTLIVFDEETHCDPKLLSLAKNNLIDIIFLYSNRLKSVLKYIKMLIFQKPDIIFSYLAFTNTLNAILGKLFLIEHRIGGIRNAFIPKSKFKLQKFFHNYFLSSSISNSHAGFDSHFSSGLNKKPIFVIPNCFLLEDQLLIRKNKTKVQILTVGRFVKQKDYNTLLVSVKTLIDESERINSLLAVRLIIIGYGEDENEITDKIAELNLGITTEIIINPLNLFEYYKSSDIYVSTSLFEGLSNSIMEAMANTLPIVATDAGDNNQLVIDGENGFIVPVKDHKAIAAKLLLLCNDFDMRIAMGKKSYELINKNFSFEIFKERYIKLIENEFKA